MSSVPPDIVGPILQSHLVHRQVSAVRDNERAQQANANRQQARAIDEKDTTVETADDDTRVNPDSQGTGSQGRAFRGPEENEEPGPEGSEPHFDSGDEEGRHIDLQA